MKTRPNVSKPGDKPLPKKMRFSQAGTLLFQPTLADRAKLFRDPDLAAQRMRCLLAVHGIA